MRLIFFKESTETMQIEGRVGDGRGALYVHLVQSEGGGRRGERRKERNGDNERGDEPKVGKRWLKDECLCDKGQMM